MKTWIVQVVGSWGFSPRFDCGSPEEALRRFGTTYPTETAAARVILLWIAGDRTRLLVAKRDEDGRWDLFDAE